MTMPVEITAPVTAAGHGPAIANLENWIQQQRLEIHPTTAAEIPTFQVIIPGPPAHPILSLQPSPHNPDLPFQKMKGLSRSPFSNGGQRLFILQALNSVVPVDDQKPESYKDTFYKLRWELLADASQFATIGEILNRIVKRVRSP
jgi:hypothetical protein